MPNDIIEGPDKFTSTDSEGKYEFIAPGGTDVTLKVLRGSTEVVATPSSGETVTEDYQYAGLEVSIKIPDGTGVPGLKVNPDASESIKRTDSNGKAEFYRIIGTDTIDINVEDGKFELSISGPKTGDKAFASETIGFGVKGNVYDSGGGNVSGVDISTDLDNPIRSVVNTDGSFVIGDSGDGKIDVIVATQDKRFIESKEEVEVEKGDVITGVELKLERDVPIGNTT